MQKNRLNTFCVCSIVMLPIKSYAMIIEEAIVKE